MPCPLAGCYLRSATQAVCGPQVTSYSFSNIEVVRDEAGLAIGRRSRVFLVPLLDLVNHCTHDPNARMEDWGTGTAFTMVATKPIPAGTEVQPASPDRPHGHRDTAADLLQLCACCNMGACNV